MCNGMARPGMGALPTQGGALGQPGMVSNPWQQGSGYGLQPPPQPGAGGTLPPPPFQPQPLPNPIPQPPQPPSWQPQPLPTPSPPAPPPGGPLPNPGATGQPGMQNAPGMPFGRLGGLLGGNNQMPVRSPFGTTPGVM